MRQNTASIDGDEGPPGSILVRSCKGCNPPADGGLGERAGPEDGLAALGLYLASDGHRRAGLAVAFERHVGGVRGQLLHLSHALAVHAGDDERRSGSAARNEERDNDRDPHAPAPGARPLSTVFTTPAWPHPV